MFSTVIKIKDKKAVLGESILSGYEECIDLIGFSHDMDLPMTQDKSSNSRTSGRPNLRDFEITTLMNKAYPKFMEYCAAGDNLGQVKVFTLRVNQGKLSIIAEYTLENVYVSQVSIRGGAMDGSMSQNLKLTADQQHHPVVTVRLNYDQISCEYTSTDNAGGQLGRIGGAGIKATA